jgi:hypothetical protein
VAIDGFLLMVGFTGLLDTARDYTLQFTITHRLVPTVMYSLVNVTVVASNGGRSPFSVFPNCPRPQLPASHNNYALVVS